MILRNTETITIQGPCLAEDAETLLGHLQNGATTVDWTGCTLLHAACLQVLLAARVKILGAPAHAPLARFAAALLAPTTSES